MSPTTTSLQRLLSSTPKSSWVSRGSLMTSTTMSSPSSVRRSLMRAEDEPITLKNKACRPVCRPVCRRQSVMIERWDPLFADLCRAPKKLRDTTLRMNTSGLSWSDRESSFSLLVKKRFENTNSKPSTTEEVFKSWMKRASRIKKNFVVLKQTNDADKINNFFMDSKAKLGSSWSSWEVSMKWKNCSDFKVQPSTQLRGRRSRYYPWSHWQDTRIPEWNKLYDWFERFSRCWISTQWTFPRYQSTSVFPTSTSSWWNAEPLFWNANPQRWAAKHLEHTWYIGKRFCKSSRAFLAPYPQELNPWSSRISEPIHSSQAVKNENQTPVQDQRCQSGLSAKNSFILSEGDFSKDSVADLQRLQISDLHFDKFTTPSTFAWWKIRFNTEVCTCSQLPTEAMQWIKEVQMVDSLDDLKSSSSIRGISMPNFEVLDARIAVTGAHDSVENYAHLGRIVQIENPSVWKTQDIGIVRPGDSSEESRTWLSQIENYGEEKYRARYSK